MREYTEAFLDARIPRGERCGVFSGRTICRRQRTRRVTLESANGTITEHIWCAHHTTLAERRGVRSARTGETLRVVRTERLTPASGGTGA